LNPDPIRIRIYNPEPKDAAKQEGQLCDINQKLINQSPAALKQLIIPRRSKPGTGI
jgi:hypothetical protein